MTTGIGQSKYCLPHSVFSGCLICLYSSLFDFNSTFTLYLFSYTIAVYGNAIKMICYVMLYVSDQAWYRTYDIADNDLF